MRAGLSEISQHYPKEMHKFIDNFSNQLQSVDLNYVPFLSKFLDPFEQKVAADLAGGYDNLKVSFFGGTINAEKKRAIVEPLYEVMAKAEDFKIDAIEISYQTKFNDLKHRQAMGFLLNQGIAENNFGDIIKTEDKKVYFLVNQDFSDFLIQKTKKISGIGVKLRKINPKLISNFENNQNETTILVKSLRIDAVITAALNSSRNEISDVIKKENVKVNWQPVVKSNIMIKVDDLISIRHFGRIKIIAINGKTTKGKYKIIISTKLKNQKKSRRN